MSTPLPTSTGRSYLQLECRTPLSLLTAFSSPWIFFPPPSATQPQSRLAAVLTRAESNYGVQGSGLDMCEETGEVGEFYQSYLEMAVCYGSLLGPGASASLPRSLGRKYPPHSVQLEGPAQPQLRGIFEFVRPHRPSSPLSSQSLNIEGGFCPPKSARADRRGAVPFPFSRTKFLALLQGALAAKRPNCACSPFLLLRRTCQIQFHSEL